MSAHPLPPIDEAAQGAASRRLDRLTKPKGSLGKLERLAVRLAGMQGSPLPASEPGALVVLAADHGVAHEGVSPYPQAVTAQMVANFLTGGAAANVLARRHGLQLYVADVGVAEDVVTQARAAGVCFVNDVVACKVSRGTRNMAHVPALGRRDAQAALDVGARIADVVIEQGARVIALGEMGIANTTSSTAMACAFLGLEPERVTGRGTGLDDAGVSHKAAVIRGALARHRPDPQDPVDVLSKVGGVEIAALAGCMLQAAARRRPVVLDGLITSAAALAAAGIQPGVLDYLIASHTSAEPAHPFVLEHLGLDPLLDLELRLGEGSGAALAMGILGAATALVREMATFEDAGVSDRDANPPKVKEAAS